MSNSPEYKVGDYVKYRNNYYKINEYFFDEIGFRYSYGLKSITDSNSYLIFKPEFLLKKVTIKEKNLIRALYG